MSKTPRTDEHLRMKEENGHVAVVSREFARQLEMENIELRTLLNKALARLFKLNNDIENGEA